MIELIDQFEKHRDEVKKVLEECIKLVKKQKNVEEMLTPLHDALMNFQSKYDDIIEKLEKKGRNISKTEAIASDDEKLWQDSIIILKKELNPVLLEFVRICQDKPEYFSDDELNIAKSLYNRITIDGNDIYIQLQNTLNTYRKNIKNEECIHLYESIIRQYIELSVFNGYVEEDGWEKIYKDNTMNDVLTKSLVFITKNQRYQDLMVNINQLADKWDIKYNQKSSDKDINEVFNIIRHSFVFSPRLDAESNVEYPFALFYNPLESPDDRIILIVIDERNTIEQNYEEILHEVGHYIGRRRRTDPQDVDAQDAAEKIKPDTCRWKIGQKMIANEWINTVYKYMCANILHEDVEETYGNMRGDITINIDKRRMMHDALYALCSDSYYKKTLELLNKGRLDTQEDIARNKLFKNIYDIPADNMSLEQLIQYAKNNPPKDLYNNAIRAYWKKLVCLNRGYLKTEMEFAWNVFFKLLRETDKLKELEKQYKSMCPRKVRRYLQKMYNRAIEQIKDRAIYAEKIVSQIEKKANEALAGSTPVVATASGEEKQEEKNTKRTLDEQLDEKILKNPYYIDSVITNIKSKACPWVSLPLKLLEEIAADIFLCEIGGVGNKYLDCLLRSFALQKSRKEKFDIKMERLLLNNDAFRTRLVALTAALNINKTIHMPGGYITKVKKGFINQAERLKRLESSYGDIETMQLIKKQIICVENPAIMAIKYARLILEDDRYLEFLKEEENKQLVIQLNMFNRKTKIQKLMSLLGKT